MGDLLEATLCEGQVQKTKKWMAEDWKAVKDVERVMELRRRGGASGGALSDVAEEAAAGNDEDQGKIALLVDAGVSAEAAARALRQENGDVSRALLAATEE